MNTVTSVSRTTARTAGELMLSLLDSTVDQPEFADLQIGVHWQITPLGRLTGSLYDVQPAESLALLVRLQERFGGVTGGTRETHSSGHRWHELTTVLDGVTVKLRVPVPQATVEQALRDRIAELEGTSPPGRCGVALATGRPCPKHDADKPVPYEVIDGGAQ